MLRRKDNKILNRKSQLLVVGSLLILIGLGVIGFKVYDNISVDMKEKEGIKNFYIEQEKIKDIKEEVPQEEIKEEEKVSKVEYNYIAVVKIPKINLERGLVSIDSKYNNVNKNIQILEDSSMPDEQNGNMILAAHSGNGRNAYFKNLDKLNTDDIVSIFYNGVEYKYKIMNIYDIEKTGTAQIIRNSQKSSLTLITCREKTNKQIIVICELIEKI